jgi:hypothetical protein
VASSGEAAGTDASGFALPGSGMIVTRLVGTIEREHGDW